MNAVTRLASTEPKLFDLWKVRGIYVARLDDGTWTPLTSREMLKIAELRRVLLARAHFLLPWTQRELDAFVNRALYQHQQVIDELPSAEDLLPVLDKVVAGIDGPFLIRPAEHDAWLTDYWCAKHDVHPDAIAAYFRARPTKPDPDAHGYHLARSLPIKGEPESLIMPDVIVERFKALGYEFEYVRGRMVNVKGGAKWHTDVYENRCPS